MLPLAIIAACGLTVITDDVQAIYAALNAVVFAMAVALADRDALRSPIRSALWLIVCVWFFCDAALSLAGATMENSFPLYLPLPILFMLWAAKTVALRQLSPDEPDPEQYVYALAPVLGVSGALNILRPSTLTIFGGRAVIAGDYIYCVHKGVFKKLRLSLVNISDYTLINSGELLNKSTTTRLDGIVGSQCIPLVHDCSSLRSDSSLETVILRRIIIWIRMNFLRRSKP